MAGPKVAAVIQARMGSSRLPGKMVMPIAGHPVLWHIIQRARKVHHATDLVLVTTALERDDPLVRLAEREGILVVRGSEENVLERYMQALELTAADYVIRITGDATLFDPAFQDEWVAALIASGADYARIREAGRRHAHQGAGTISAKGLRWIWKVGHQDPLAREHVTAYAREHQDELNTVEISIDPELVGEFHLSIDTLQDLDFMRWIYDQLYRPGEIVDLREAVRLLRRASYPIPA